MTETASTFVRVNRLKEGWTCNVQVGADDNTMESLQAAKERALAIVRELDAELNPVIVESALEDEVPF